MFAHRLAAEPRRVALLFQAVVERSVWDAEAVGEFSSGKMFQTRPALVCIVIENWVPRYQPKPGSRSGRSQRPSVHPTPKARWEAATTACPRHVVRRCCLQSDTGVCGVVAEPVVVEKTFANRDLGRNKPSLRLGSGPRSTRSGKSGSLTAASLRRGQHRNRRLSGVNCWGRRRAGVAVSCWRSLQACRA